MENKPIKLAPPFVSEYSYFEDNQILTARQLNTVIDYFDQQHRLTRNKALGVGIIGGLDVTFDQLTGSISVSKGAALTSDGDLLHLDDDTQFTQYKPIDNRLTGYAVFSGPAGGWELLPANLTDPDAKPLVDWAESIPMNDLVVLLYLNSYLRPTELCTGADCDNQGPTQKAELKVALVSIADLNQATSEQERFKNPYFELPTVAMERVIFGANTKETTDLRTAFGKAVDAVIEPLSAALTTSFNPFRKLLTPLYNNTDPTPLWTRQLRATLTNHRDKNTIQYVYDYFGDLIDAYTEFREATFDLYVENSPDSRLFPKHIVLGELLTSTSGMAPTSRHLFWLSPLFDKQDNRVRKAQLLHWRISLLVRGFDVPGLSMPIRITPSRNAGRDLGDRAIPYYYYMSRFDLVANWSFDAAQKRRTSDILSYHTASAEPLKYRLGSYDFFRIEGHLGKNVDDVSKQIDSIKKQYNLSFRIEIIQLEDKKSTLPTRVNLSLANQSSLFQQYRDELFTNLSRVKTFSAELVERIAGSNVKEDIRTVTARKNTDLNDKITEVSNVLKSDFQTIDLDKFNNSFREILTISDDLNKTVQDVTDSSTITPIQKLVADGNFNKVGSVLGKLKLNLDASKELSIFHKFLEKHPGLEHQAGVAPGGTFVLVYSSDSKLIVADFALPYYAYPEIEAEEPVQQLPPAVQPEVPPFFVPGKWLGRVDMFKDQALKQEFDNAKLANNVFISEVIDRKVADISKIFVSQKERFDDLISFGKRDAGPLTGTIKTDAGDIRGKIAEAMKNEAEEIKKIRAKGRLTLDDQTNLQDRLRSFDVAAEILVNTYKDSTEFSADDKNVTVIQDAGKLINQVRVGLEAGTKISRTDAALEAWEKAAADKPTTLKYIQSMKIINK